MGNASLNTGMKLCFHFITAATRLHNLGRLADELNRLAWTHEVHWHLRFDPHHKAIGGHPIKNQIIDHVTYDPCDCFMVLVDATLPHPDLLAVAHEERTNHPG